MIYGSQFLREAHTKYTGQTNYNTLPTGNCFYQFEDFFLSRCTCKNGLPASAITHFGLRVGLSFSLTLNSQIQLAFSASEESAAFVEIHTCNWCICSFTYISHRIALMVFVHEFNESNLRAPKWYFSSKKISICEQAYGRFYAWLMSSHARLIFIMLIEKREWERREEVSKKSSKSPKDALQLIKASAFTKMDFKCT